MQLTLTLDIPPLPKPITYSDSILLLGSCFTEHISERLAKHKFHLVSNPHGILFNPLSVANSIDSYTANKLYTKDELFYLNELWNSWDHHTRFSNVDANETLNQINRSQQEASASIKNVAYVIITLGSAFQYYLVENGKPVANNHRAPAQWFEKKLLSIAEITEALGESMERLFAINPDVQVLFTVSPVRHIRDGVVDNNRSKARLIEAVHSLCSNFANAYYFPAYELVVDILRDYRFYDIDFVHPNYLATQFVWDQFVSSCIEPCTRNIMQQVLEIVTARSHRPRFPGTDAHKKFKADYLLKTQQILKQYPFLDMSEELQYFV